jgi:hypothetical protein
MKKLIVGFSLLIFGYSVCHATPIIWDSSYWGYEDTYTYDTSGMDDSSLPAIPTLSPGYNSGGVVRFGFAGDGVSPAVMIGSSNVNFSEDFSSKGPDLGVRFTFTSITPDVNPYSLNLYFKAGGQTYISTWHAYLSSVAGPTTFDIGIADAANWNNMDNFVSIFQSVTEFGFEVAGGSYSGLQEYEISDVQFTVPEPETVWMILMVLASLGITFRSRLMELAGQVKARIRA